MEEVNCFYVCNGHQLWNLEDLLNELNTIDDDSFSYHVNEEKNDFFNWVNGEIKDRVLSKQLSTVKDREKMIKLIEKRIFHSSRRKKVISQIREAIVNG